MIKPFKTYPGHTWWRRKGWGVMSLGVDPGSYLAWHEKFPEILADKYGVGDCIIEQLVASR